MLLLRKFLLFENVNSLIVFNQNMYFWRIQDIFASVEDLRSVIMIAYKPNSKNTFLPENFPNESVKMNSIYSVWKVLCASVKSIEHFNF